MPGHSHFRAFSSKKHATGTGSGTIYTIYVPRTDGSGGTWSLTPIALFWPNITGTSTPVIANFIATGLHGGSGNWINFARNLGFLKTNALDPAYVDWDYLARVSGVIAVCNGLFATRGALVGYPDNSGAYNPNGVETVSVNNPQGIRTWSAGQMWSGQQDDKYLLDWSSWIIADPMGLGLGPSIGRNLFGHSNGGMMAQYMWRIHPTSFTKYGGISCPLVDDTFTGGSGGSDPPSSGRPFVAFYGGSDTTLNLFNGPAGPGDHFYDLDTVQSTIANNYPDPGSGSIADVLYNPVVAPYFFPNQYVGPYARFQAQLLALGGFSTPTPTIAHMANGAIQTTWIETNTNCVLQVVAGAGHDLTSQEQTTGRRRLSDIINAWGHNYSALNPGV